TTIAAGALRSISALLAPAVRTTAACPDTNPPFGIVTTVVTPSLRAGAQSGEAVFSPSQARNAAAPAWSPVAVLSRVFASPPTSTRPSDVAALIKPGVIHLPVASMTRAPAGGVRLAPTAVMVPPVMITVACSIGAPDTG